MRIDLDADTVFELPKPATASVNAEGQLALQHFRWTDCRVVLSRYERAPLALDEVTQRPYYERHWSVFAGMRDANTGSELVRALRYGRKLGAIGAMTCPPMHAEHTVTDVLLSHRLLPQMSSKDIVSCLEGLSPQDVLARPSPDPRLSWWAWACKEKRLPLIAWMLPGLPEKSEAVSHVWWLWTDTMQQSWKEAMVRDGLIKKSWSQAMTKDIQQMDDILTGYWAQCEPHLTTTAGTSRRLRLPGGEVSPLVYLLMNARSNTASRSAERETKLLQAWIRAGGDIPAAWPEGIPQEYGETPVQFLRQMGREDLVLPLELAALPATAPRAKSARI